MSPRKGSPVSASTAPVCPLTLLAWRLGALRPTDLWWRYVALGGNRGQPVLDAYLAGTTRWPAGEHNAVAHALNEGLWDVGHASLAPYRAPDAVGAGTPAPPAGPARPAP
jgi:hypothetical protein